MEHKKYEIWEDENLVFSTNSVDAFSCAVGCNYPLGDFYYIDDCGDRIVITFSNYWFNIYK